MRSVIRRIQGLSVNEVDPSGENLEMVLNNLREKRTKGVFTMDKKYYWL